ncbi:SDR family oxidoreductase [uncultured Rhodoferax sp.]|uniref:SDR family oxidoreductase n=1 Tax=uncultured Rhodoferax sp. TaxID=223188 RepID=UPI0025D15D09|nr:SDR family oxidoreductase [uncultured Rhodoferax sp.]
MRVFVTGATGFIGSAIVQELLAAGHQVLGLARTDAGAASLRAAGAEVHRGDLQDLDSLRRGAAMADGVIHTAFNHDFSKFKANCEADRSAIDALGSALRGSRRPLVITSGTGLLPSGRLGVESDVLAASATEVPRVASEEAAAALAVRGVHVCVVRLPPSVHGVGDHGFVPLLIGIARQHGASAYVGEGLNHWPAVHRLDAAQLYRLVLEKGVAGARYHGAAEGGVPFKDIATAIGQGLRLPVLAKTPEEAAAHFGWFAHFAGLDNRVSSQHTRETLGWNPSGPGLLEDLALPSYFAA